MEYIWASIISYCLGFHSPSAGVAVGDLLSRTNDRSFQCPLSQGGLSFRKHVGGDSYGYLFLVRITQILASPYIILDPSPQPVGRLDSIEGAHLQIY